MPPCSSRSPSALKFGFLAVLYLFLLWVSRSALKDLRRAARGAAAAGRVPAPRRRDRACTPRRTRRAARRRSSRGWSSSARPGTRPGMEYESARARSWAAATRPRSASRTRSPPRATRGSLRQGGIVVLEDLGSTNGTYLNEELLAGPQPLHPGDRVRIGDSEFTYADR